MRRAVAAAVPDGASFFSSWWSSMTSAAGKKRAASSESRCATIEPIEKFGATIMPASPCRPSIHPRISSSSAGPMPVVPTTPFTSCSTM
jgi:hypothetical protein